MNYDKPILIDIKKWFNLTSEFSGIERDLFFKEAVNSLFLNEKNANLPNSIIIALSNSDGLLSKSNDQFGVSHWNWKGGITSENKKERASSKYKKWRTSVFRRDKFTCNKCTKKGGKLNAHHIIPFSVNKELRYVLSNGTTLCETCHIDLHKTDRQWL